MSGVEYSEFRDRMTSLFGATEHRARPAPRASTASDLGPDIDGGSPRFTRGAAQDDFAEDLWPSCFHTQMLHASVPHRSVSNPPTPTNAERQRDAQLRERKERNRTAAVGSTLVHSAVALRALEATKELQALLSDVRKTNRAHDELRALRSGA